MFDFIHEAMKEVTYPRFFNVQPLDKSERKRLDALPQLPLSYLEFLHTFGKARFFRELYSDTHHLLVFPPPDKMHFYGDSYMIDVAAANSTQVSFKFSELQRGVEPPLYDIALGIAPASPRPRAQLPPHQGMVAIEFTNRSDGILNRYSIGVTNKYSSRFFGGFSVDVSKVVPGTTAVVHVPLRGYSHLLTAQMATLFDKGEPKPESREDFWEFRAINGTAR